MIDIEDVEAAAARLDGVAVRTPLIRSPELDRISGGHVLLKPECFQFTGSFKIRGAYNMLSQLGPEQVRYGVVAYSSGNHAQAVAAASAMLGTKATIVMPEDAPRAKLENTRRLGGEVVTYDRYRADREAIAREIAEERGALIVPPFEHPDIIAGQGTVGLEIVEQSREEDICPDQVLICCGGGGLTAGCAVALKARLPDVVVHTVEPENYDDVARSLACGERVTASTSTRSICDALLADQAGALTFEIMRRLVNSGLVVTEEEVREAMRFAFRHLKVVTEPGGAAALAAVLAGKIDLAGKTTAVVISGGNVDAELFASVQARPY